MNLADLRKEYTQRGLSESDAPLEPISLFREWFQQAMDAALLEPNAMVLSTCSKKGQPSSRVVLLKSFDERGFTFFTNYLSRKGRELAENPLAALNFFWPDIERQIRIEGTVAKVSPDESDRYFASRPVESRLGARVSPQSEVISGRAELEEKLKAFKDADPEGNQPRPEHWGGFRLEPSLMEFWQGRPARLHDRLRYRRQTAQHPWTRDRLAP